jgi:hypothetical protein
MAQITPVGTVDVGIFINPNTFTRQIAKSYEIVGNRINLLSTIFTSGQRSPVRTSDTRWTFAIPSNLSTNGSINDSANGLDGTTIYTYAGADYLLKSPLFLVTNNLATTEVRPATIYESFLKMMEYIDTQIATRYQAVLSTTNTGGGTAGNANTGLITFDNVRIIGAGTASGDLAGSGTMELVPDLDLYIHDQYLVIDPTTGGHIHIRAGGDQDASNSILFLGGENAHVRVSNNDNELGDLRDNTVSIRAYNATDELSYDWVFGNDGKVTLPTKQTIGYHYDYILEGNTLQLGTPNVETIITGPAANSTYPNAQRIVIQGQQGYGTGEGGDVYIWGGCGDFLGLADDTESAEGGDIKVRGGFAYGTGQGGYANIQGGDAKGTGSGNGGYVNLEGGLAEGSGNGGYVNLYGGNANGVGDGGPVHILSGQSFAGTGGDVIIESNYGSVAGGKVSIKTNEPLVGTNEWQFNSLGNIILPAGGDIKDSNGNSVLSAGTETVYVNTLDTEEALYVLNYESVSTLTKHTYLFDADGEVELTLPDDMTSPVELIIGDISGNAETNPISIYPAVGQSVIGLGSSPSIIINTNYGTVSLKWIATLDSWIILYGR